MVVKYIIKKAISKLMDRFLNDYIKTTDTDQLSYDIFGGAYEWQYDMASRDERNSCYCKCQTAAVC